MNDRIQVGFSIENNDKGYYFRALVILGDPPPPAIELYRTLHTFHIHLLKSIHIELISFKALRGLYLTTYPPTERHLKTERHQPSEIQTCLVSEPPLYFDAKIPTKKYTIITKTVEI